MIKSIKNALDNSTSLDIAEKKTYGKPIQDEQPANYIFFLSNNKIRIKTGYRHSFSFHIIGSTTDNIEIMGKALEELLICERQSINNSIWKIVQNGEKDFADEGIKVMDFTFYYTFN